MVPLVLCRSRETTYLQCPPIAADADEPMPPAPHAVSAHAASTHAADTLRFQSPENQLVGKKKRKTDFVYLFILRVHGAWAIEPSEWQATGILETPTRLSRNSQTRLPETPLPFIRMCSFLGGSFSVLLVKTSSRHMQPKRLGPTWDARYTYLYVKNVVQGV